MFDINNFVVDEVKRIIGRDRTTGELYFLIDQIERSSLQCDSNEIVKKNSKGSPIARWWQGKTAEFSGTNALLSFNFLSHQLNGEDKITTNGVNPIVAPEIEDVILGSDNLTSYTLRHSVANSGSASAPVYKITVCTLSNTGSVIKKFKIGQSVSKGVFTYAAGTKTINFNEGDLKEGDRLYVQYEYNTQNAIAIYNSANKFPKAMEIVVEVIGGDLCDRDTVYVGYIVFPNAMLSPTVALAFQKEDSFDFAFSATQVFCGKKKELFHIVVPQPNDNTDNIPENEYIFDTDEDSAEIIFYVGKDKRPTIPEILNGKCVRVLSAVSFSSQNIVSAYIPDGVQEIG